MANYTVGIYTLGCKVNQYESEAIAEHFVKEGFTVLPWEEICDVYVINTCTVTAESDRKARQFIRRAVHRNPNARILVTGCFSQVSPMQVAKIQGVDDVSGNAEKLFVVERAKELLKEPKKGDSPAIRSSEPDEFGFERMEIRHFDRTRTYVKIEDGCENRCTYCIIPDARGKVRSKTPEAVLSEVEALVKNGCREVVLTGIETASYGKDLGDYSLADLLSDVDLIKGIGRVRLGSLDPSLMKEDFVNKISKLSSITPHFHLSLQSGSDSVLARMKRKYNRRMALDGMKRLRRAFPTVNFTTDVIAGFPGETEEEFSETLSFLKEAEFLNVHVFPYSRRKGTPADKMPEQIPEQVKHERVERVISLQNEIRKKLLDRLTGKTVSVLFESEENGRFYGHTREFEEVFVETNLSLHAKILPVKILGNDGTSCYGTLTKEIESEKEC